MPFGVGNKTILVVLLIFCFFLNACGQTEDELLKKSQSIEKNAIELAKANDIEGAIKEQRKAVELRPEDAKRLALLGRFLIDRHDKTKSSEDLKEAEGLLKKAVLKQPNDILLRNTLIVVLEKLGDSKGVLRECIEVLKIDPDDLQNLTNLGTAYNNVNDSESARKILNEVLEKNPNYIYGLYHYGEFEADSGNVEKAIQLFERAVKSKPQPETDDSQYLELSRKRFEELKNKRAKSATAPN